MNVVLDDHLLREVLLEQEPSWLRRHRGRGAASTTGSWYYRLCSSLQEPDLIGSLSGPIMELPLDIRTGVIERVITLPSSIGLLSMRELGWPASALGRRHGLNLVAAEALAAAITTGSAIATAAPNLPPRLTDAAQRERVRVLTPPASATGRTGP